MSTTEPTTDPMKQDIAALIAALLGHRAFVEGEGVVNCQCGHLLWRIWHGFTGGPIAAQGGERYLDVAHARHVAEVLSALVAASPEPEVVTTVEELDALPVHRMRWELLMTDTTDVESLVPTTRTPDEQAALDEWREKVARWPGNNFVWRDGVNFLAGFRAATREPETVTTVEELDALPVQSIVVNGTGDVSYTRRPTGWYASFGETVAAHLLLEPWHTSQPLRLVFRPAGEPTTREEGTGDPT